MGPNARKFLELARAWALDHRYRHIRQFCDLAELGLLDEDTAGALLYTIRQPIDEQKRRPNFLYRAPDFEEIYPDGPPDLTIGHLEENEGVPIGLFIDGPMFCIFVGRAGSGKTTAVRSLIRAVGQYNRAHPETPLVLIACDRKSHDYGDAASLLDGRCLHFTTQGDPLIGLNAPVGMPPNLWINTIASDFCAPAGLRYAWVTLANLMRWALAAMNPQPMDPLRWPDLETLLALARRIGRRFTTKLDYLDALIQMLEGIVGASGNLFKTFNGLDLERDVISKKLSAVISMPNLEPFWARRFLSYLLIDQVLCPRMHFAHRVSRTEVLFIIEEGDADISQRAEDAFQDGMSAISKAERYGRQFGVGVGVVAGKLGGACRDVLNSANLFCNFAVGDAPSMEEAAATLDLKQSVGLLPALESGECVLRLPGSWGKAILGKIDYIKPNLSPPAQYDVLPVIPSIRLKDNPELLGAIAQFVKETEAEALREGLKHKSNQLAEAGRLLELAADNPWVPLARLWEQERTEISPEKRKRAVMQLKDRGLAAFEDLRVRKVNNRLILILPKGWEALGRTPPKIQGRGGVAHVNCAHWIANHLAAQNFHPEIEKPVPNTDHYGDVSHQLPDGRWHVYEAVVHCETNIVSHLQACLLQTDLVARVTIVAAQLRQLKSLQKVIEGEASLVPFHAFITYETIDKYMEV